MKNPPKYNTKLLKSYQRKFLSALDYLRTKDKPLFLLTSNRWEGESTKDIPKSSQLAFAFAKRLKPKHVEIVDVSHLRIYPCEGNVSSVVGNKCGVRGAVLRDHKKDPSGCHRCWASINNADDELWKVSRPLLKSDCVVFFGSIRWGQMNSYYQKLIERLTWLENRHATLNESNLLSRIDAGIIAVGHNWNGGAAVKTQKQVLSFFGFRVKEALCWNWEFTDANNESLQSYSDAIKAFAKTFPR